MNEIAGTEASEQSPASVDAWRERLLRFVAFATGTALISGPLIHWAVVGEPPNITVLVVAIGLVIFALAFLEAVSVDVRSWVFCAAFLVVVAAIVLNFGFAPAFVGAYNLLLLAAGLLLGRVSMVLVTVIGVGGLLAAGLAVDAGTFVVEADGRDPTDLNNWVRAAALFGAASAAILAIVRFATRTVDNQYARVQRELARARELRMAAERARANRLLRQRELRGSQKIQAVGALSGGIAHLFNNALTVVQSVVEALQKDTSEPSRAQARDRLIEAMAPAVRVTQDLLIFSRRDFPEPESVELGPLVANFAETLGQTIPVDVNLGVSSAPGMTVAADAAALKQLLLNLVLNAADAADAPGNVRITVAPFKDGEEVEVRWAAIAVEDDGAGMSEATLNQAIDPFFTTRDGRSGLGLSVAHAIAAQAGGELSLESREGVGTRAVVLLPLERARVGLSPAALWPNASALHGPDTLRSPDALESDENFDFEPPPEPAWQDAVTRRLGRVAAVIMVALGIVVAVLLPKARAALLATTPVGAGLMAAAGWGRFVPPPVARFFLIAGFWLLGTVAVYFSSFDNMAGMSIILIAIAWSGLLGGRWMGPLTVLVSLASLLAIGSMYSGNPGLGVPANSNMNVAANWYRFAPQLGLYSLLLSTGVLGALAAVRRGARSEQAALDRIEALRRAEAREGARLLALETRSAQAERVEAAGQAAGTIAHDLMNAVQTLTGAVEVLAFTDGADEQHAELLASLANAAGYAEALATQFYSVSPTIDDEGHAPVCNVSAIITSMAALMQHVLPERIELAAQVAPDLVVRISETDLRRLLFNLVSNARDAIAGEGSISISLSADDGTITLRVSDTGGGMDDATKAQIFEPFYSSKAPGGGTGLGLHSVDDIVRRTRGVIEVESQPGEGAMFVVSWPAEARPVEASGAQQEAQARAVDSAGTILLAEDEPLVRAIMAEALVAAGFDVIEACDGDEGVRLALEDTDYVAACIDGVMPGASSVEVIDSFQKAHPGRPVLLCSGYMPAELANRGLLKAGVTFMAKPFAPSRLQEELRAALERSG